MAKAFVKPDNYHRVEGYSERKYLELACEALQEQFTGIQFKVVMEQVRCYGIYMVDPGEEELADCLEWCKGWVKGWMYARQQVIREMLNKVEELK